MLINHIESIASAPSTCDQEPSRTSREPMHERNQPTDRSFEVTYTEYETGSGLIVEIADPENDQAWLRASVTMPIER